jgi:hypothetical protein
MAEKLTADDQRVQDRDIETAAGWPSSHEMIVQLREALGLFAGAMPISPQQAWEGALAEVRRLRTEPCSGACLLKLKVTEPDFDYREPSSG